MRRLASLALLAALLPAPAQPPAEPVQPPAEPAQQEGKPPPDDTNPRAPTTPLKIPLTPYWCPLCAAEGLVKGDPPDAVGDGKGLIMMRKPVADLAHELHMGPAGKEWIAIATPHFRVMSTLKGTFVKLTDSVFTHADLERLKTILPKVTIGREGATLDAHQRLHLYHVRLEREYNHFAALVNNEQPYLGMPRPYEIYLFADYAEHHAFCDRYIGGRNDKNAVQHHDKEPPNFILMTTAESIAADRIGKGDGPLSNMVFHNVAHLLIDGCNNYFRETPGWLEEGLGHYYERRENIRWNNFCWAEGTPPTDFVKPDWETTIFSLVRRGKAPQFSTWCDFLQPGELTAVENGLSWSIVKWMIETEPVRFTKMIDTIDDLKRNLTSTQEIEEGFGVSPSVIDQRWREYVLKNYAGR